MQLTGQDWALLRTGRFCTAYWHREVRSHSLEAAHDDKLWERLFHKLEGGDPAMKKAKPAAKKAAAKPAPKAGKSARKGCCK